MKKIIISLSLLACVENSYATVVQPLFQTREEARRSYEIQREIARQKNDTATLYELNNNLDAQRRDITSNYRDPAPRIYNYR